MGVAGRFITFEGIEGSGKSTQIERLRSRLESAGAKVLVTREPGGTVIGEAIRVLLLDPAHEAMSVRTELLLYAAARAQHVAERIAPALASGNFVLCDRFGDSTAAYQGGGRNLPPGDLDWLYAFAAGDCEPDLTLLLDLPVEVGLRRAAQTGKPDRLERESVSFHNRVREAFLELARLNPNRMKIIDSTQDTDTVAALIWTYVEPMVGTSQ